MPEAAQPEEVARRTTSPPRDITRPEAFVRTGPLLARRAQRDAPPPKMVPKPPIAPRPKLLPSLGQGNVSLVSANTWDESTKKKGKKGVRVQRSSLGLRHIPRDLEMAMMRPRLVKSAVPSQRPYQPWDDEDEVDICALPTCAPFFDYLGRVFGMHTGGFAYKDKRTQITESVLEYALPLLTILQNFVIRLKEDNNQAVLKRVHEEAQNNLFLFEALFKTDGDEPMDES
ncbi:uncharacterized protein LOC121555442 [Coregonus clupeaformis]|uniref:uncharacterized protein LOC121555442 n=1 Tax=Coregonus clupeaformis TaxID=59861 RepID=UPI001E1C54D7|nr:uncharacterized protein LOC121555442 [Coregonus clupeaformis]